MHPIIACTTTHVLKLRENTFVKFFLNNTVVSDIKKKISSNYKMYFTKSTTLKLLMFLTRQLQEQMVKIVLE